MKPNIFAAIHLGSEEINMKIIEYTSLADIKVIDECSYDIKLSEEAFQTGKISFQKVNKVCEILKGYKLLLDEYKVTDYRIIATTAVREAENQQYIIDQILLKTGFEVEVINLTQEIFYKYAALYRSISKNSLIKKQNAILFMDISSGGLGFTLYKKDKILYQQNMHIGAIRIKKAFEKNQRESIYFFEALTEYIYSIIKTVQQDIKNYDIKYLVLSGLETKLLLKMLKKEEEALNFISIEEFNNIYNEIKTSNLTQIMKNFSLKEDDAETVLPTLALYKETLNLIDCKEIVISQDKLIDGLITFYIAYKTEDKLKYNLQEQILSLAREIAKKYNYDEPHCRAVEDFSLTLFDKLSKIHGMKERERFLLQVTAILHDVGKYVNLRKHYFYSYRLIISSDIVGCSKNEKDIIANAALYHSRINPQKEHETYAPLSKKDRITVAKLSAILKIANALDMSSRQKITNLKIILKDDEMILKVKSNKSLNLEQWGFKARTEFFEQVFGFKVNLLIEAR